MKSKELDSFFFSNMPDKYLFSIINLIRPNDNFIFKNNYSKKIMQINNLAPEKNKIKKDFSEDLFLSDLFNSFFFEFFEIHGSPLSSNPNNYFSLKKGIIATSESEAFRIFVFINKIIRRLLVTKLREIEDFKITEKLSPRLNKAKKDLILSVNIIDRNLHNNTSNTVESFFSVKKFDNSLCSELWFSPDKKTLSKRINILKIASFSNNSLSASEIHNSTRNSCYIINAPKKDVFFIDEHFEIKKASLAFCLTNGVFVGKKISSIKKEKSATPFVLKLPFYIFSKTIYDTNLIAEITTGVNDAITNGYFIVFDEVDNGFQLLSTYEYYISFLYRNNYCEEKDFFKDVLPNDFYHCRDRARSTVSKLNRMITDGQIMNQNSNFYTLPHKNVLEIRNSMIDKKIEMLSKIKSGVVIK